VNGRQRRGWIRWELLLAAAAVAVVLAGLMPIMFGSGAGSEVMQRIAAPMVGGMITAPLLSMFVIPATYLLIQRRRWAVPHRWFGKHSTQPA